MSAVEILVACVALVVGYAVVAHMMKPSDTAAAPAAPVAVPEGEPAWHRVLDVPVDASADEIRAAYRALMSQYHPDKVASLGVELRELSERKTKEISAAYREAMSARGIDA